MSNFLFIAIIMLIMIIGLGKICTSINAINIRMDFTQEYLKKFGEFCIKINQGSFDNEKYIWLTSNVAKIQDELGENGIVFNYHPPYAGYMYKRYQLLVNTLPRIRTGQADRIDIAACEDALIRHWGSLRELHSNYIGYIKNPFIWLREGINLLITFPIRLAYWFGLFEYGFLVKVTNNIFVRTLGFIVGIIGLISSIMTIAIGWNDFCFLIKTFLFG